MTIKACTWFKDHRANLIVPDWPVADAPAPA